MFAIESIGHATFVVRLGPSILIIDPWLAERLDRFWTHWPPLAIDVDLGEINVIFISHHHFDHHHFPSLSMLPKDALVLFPKGDSCPDPSRAGMGHQVIEWTLRRLGFNRLRPLEHLESIELDGGARLTTLPSRVAFPEQSLVVEYQGSSAYFAGDTMLHPQQMEYLLQREAAFDVAVVPVHSVAPATPLLLREPEPEYTSFQDRAIANFELFAGLVKAELLVPGAFGWKVETRPPERSAEWLNRLLFPLTPSQAVELLDGKRNVVLLGSGDSCLLRPGRTVDVRRTRPEFELARFFDDLTLEPTTTIPPLMSMDDDEAEPELLVERLAAAYVGTKLWFESLEQRLARVLHLEGSTTNSFLLTPWTARGYECISDSVERTLPWTRIGVGQLHSLLDAGLLVESAFGLWTGTDRLLAAVFGNPSYYVRHVNAWLRGPGRID